MDTFDFHGRTALVTGGFSGLGRHFAQVLATHGARVALAGRRLELGRREAKTIGTAVGREGDVRAYAMDVTDAASVEAAFDAASADLGVPTIVINNAGTVARGRSPARSLPRGAAAASSTSPPSWAFGCARKSPRTLPARRQWCS